MDDEHTATPFRFTAQNIDEVFAVLKDVTSIRHNAIYMRLMRQPDGVALGRTAMPHLPSSRREVLLQAGRSDTTAFVSSTVKVEPTDVVMNGSAQFALTIENQEKVETGNGHRVRINDAPEPAKSESPKPKSDAPAASSATGEPHEPNKK